MKAILNRCFKQDHGGVEKPINIPEQDRIRAYGILDKIYKGSKKVDSFTGKDLVNEESDNYYHVFSDDEVVINDYEDVTYLKQLFDRRCGSGWPAEFPVLSIVQEVKDLFDNAKKEKPPKGK